MNELKAIQIDFRAGSPIYIQIVEQIRQQVASGELKPNDQLPTVRQLASELRVNFNTIARAYRILDEAGLISTQQGRGTYILEETTPEVSRNIKDQSLQEMARTFIHETMQLGFSLDEILQVLKNSGEENITNEEINN
jgi:GntR family transcriptional regulator